MTKIVLLCAGGMSTSILVNKMNEAFKEEGFTADVHAYGLAESKNVVPDADVVLLGPQVRFNLDNLRNEYPDKIIETIEMKDYGTMNGKAVVDFVLEKIADK